MSKQIRKSKQATTREPEEQEEIKVPAKADMTITDELLDEIDKLLEPNAQAFVAAYVQQGGQ